MLKFNLFFLSIILLFQHELNATKYKQKQFMCADQIGPRFEFILPSFRNENKKTLLKIFDLENRKLFYEKLSEFKKKKVSSTIHIFFYVAEVNLNQNDYNKVYFEFFPPSTMMVKVDESQFENLACWTLGND